MRGGVLGRAAPDLCACVRSGQVGLAHEPGTMRSFREPSIWRTRAPISICGPTDQMERSGAAGTGERGGVQCGDLYATVHSETCRTSFALISGCIGIENVLAALTVWGCPRNVTRHGRGDALDHGRVGRDDPHVAICIHAGIHVVDASYVDRVAIDREGL